MKTVFKPLLFVFCCLFLVAPNISHSLNSTIPSSQMDGGIVDIMQVKPANWMIYGYGCSSSIGIIKDHKGKTKLKPIHLTSDYFHWSFSTKNWTPGKYQIVITSTDPSCSKTLDFTLVK